MTTSTGRRRLLAAGAAAMLVPLGQARAQAWRPDKPITLIVPWPAGGASDRLGLAQK